jgi:hypothetical protein
MFENAKQFIHSKIPPHWQALLDYNLYLHEGSIHAPHSPLKFNWHDSGHSTVLCFGTFEASLAAMNLVSLEPKFAIEQVYNILSLQQADGFLPSYLIFNNDLTTRYSQMTAPVLWPWIIESARQKGHSLDLKTFFEALKKQIKWWEVNRKTDSGGFFFLDIQDGFSESTYGLELRFLPQGLDEELLLDSCIDATCQMYALYDIYLKWASLLKEEVTETYQKLEKIRFFIQNQLFDTTTQFFHDEWHINKKKRPICVLGLWPIFCRAANAQQSLQILREHLLNPQHFYCTHPITSLSQSHKDFSPIGWLGPVRNSQLLLLTLGLKGYDLSTAASHLIERALNTTADQFTRSANIWEFYHPLGGHPQEMIKLVDGVLETPSPSHTTHNPLIALGYEFVHLR